IELQERGVTGMSFTDVLARSGAARGAIYHHFPDGKAQLVAEAAEAFGHQVRDQIAILPVASPTAVVQAFVEAIRPVVAASSRGAGCAVAAVAVGANVDQDRLRRAAASAFSSWTDQLAERLQLAGMDRRAASNLAQMMIMILEGAHVLCRATGNTEPFEHAARSLTALMRNGRSR
ncbi:MAG: TetR/AcrR family transcriptional regulator, partial [Mycobacterium sp.]|nr:TetR/AcrR family transcriptional regulator [Mycobacterium sp.]